MFGTLVWDTKPVRQVEKEKPVDFSTGYLVSGGAGEIEPMARKTISVLDLGLKLLSPILKDTPINTPSVIG
jgi:hypothetical protein